MGVGNDKAKGHRALLVFLKCRYFHLPSFYKSPPWLSVVWRTVCKAKSESEGPSVIRPFLGLPQWSSGCDFAFQWKDWVQSLVRELRSHMPWGQEIKTQNRSSIKTNWIKIKNGLHKKILKKKIKSFPIFHQMIPLPPCTRCPTRTGLLSLSLELPDHAHLCTSICLLFISWWAPSVSEFIKSSWLLMIAFSNTMCMPEKKRYSMALLH